MTPAAADHLAIVKQQREDLHAQYRQIEKAHALAVLDHLAAYLRDACPEAVYVTFAYYGNTRTLDLNGVLGAQSSPWARAPGYGTAATRHTRWPR